LFCYLSTSVQDTLRNTRHYVAATTGLIGLVLFADFGVDARRRLLAGILRGTTLSAFRRALAQSCQCHAYVRPRRRERLPASALAANGRQADVSAPRLPDPLRLPPLGPSAALALQSYLIAIALFYNEVQGNNMLAFSRELHCGDARMLATHHGCRTI
jgi:hypothetical protein